MSPMEYLQADVAEPHPLVRIDFGCVSEAVGHVEVKG